MLKFSSPHGDFSFSMARYTLAVDRRGARGFRPLTGISLFLSTAAASAAKILVFVPSRGFLFFYIMVQIIKCSIYRFRPLTGISLFLSFRRCYEPTWTARVFVPSRGFLFFYKKVDNKTIVTSSFRPLTGISLFLLLSTFLPIDSKTVFVPSRGFLFFYEKLWQTLQTTQQKVFVPSRGFLFFYGCYFYTQKTKKDSFRPLTGISLFLSLL